jgi:hypothetical protein
VDGRGISRDGLTKSGNNHDHEFDTVY